MMFDWGRGISMLASINFEQEFHSTLEKHKMAQEMYEYRKKCVRMCGLFVEGLTPLQKLEFIPAWVEYAMNFRMNTDTWLLSYGYPDLFEFICIKMYIGNSPMIDYRPLMCQMKNLQLLKNRYIN